MHNTGDAPTPAVPTSQQRRDPVFFCPALNAREIQMANAAGESVALHSPGFSIFSSSNALNQFSVRSLVGSIGCFWNGSGVKSYRNNLDGIQTWFLSALNFVIDFKAFFKNSSVGKASECRVETWVWIPFVTSNATRNNWRLFSGTGVQVYDMVLSRVSLVLLERKWR